MSGGGMAGVSSTGMGQPSGTYPGQQTPPPVQQQPESITGYYRNILNRDPEQGGLDFWTKQANSGMSMDEIKSHFLNSEEYINNPVAQARYKSQFSNLVTPQQTVIQAPVQQPVEPVVQQIPTLPPEPIGPVFNAPIITQDNNGGAINYQYNRGGITSLVRR